LKLEHEVKLQTETSLLSNIWFYIEIQQEKCWDLASQFGDQQRPTGQSGQAERKTAEIWVKRCTMMYEVTEPGNMDIRGHDLLELCQE